MKNSLLPIGSIVTVGVDNLMICQYIPNGKLIDGVQYDYACCLYPTGIGEKSILIKKTDIDIVTFIGYKNDSFSKFKEILENGGNINDVRV